MVPSRVRDHNSRGLMRKAAAASFGVSSRRAIGARASAIGLVAGASPSSSVVLACITHRPPTSPCVYRVQLMAHHRNRSAGVKSERAGSGAWLDVLARTQDVLYTV